MLATGHPHLTVSSNPCLRRDARHGGETGAKQGVILKTYRSMRLPYSDGARHLVGKEGITWLAERDIDTLIGRSATSGGDVARLETGAQNFSISTMCRSPRKASRSTRRASSGEENRGHPPADGFTGPG